MHPDQDKKKIKRLVEQYNMMANLFWSALNLIPISIFCYLNIHLKLFFVLLAISLLSVLLPKSFFDHIQLVRTAAGYKRIGVGFINRFAQNGDFINNLVRKKFPQYKMVRPGSQSVRKLINQTYMFERFHLMMFLLFSFIIVYALLRMYLGWAAVMFISNIIYNVYPNLLQQYIRVRLRPFLRDG